MGVRPGEDYVLRSVLAFFNIWKRTSGLIGGFAELELWSLPLMANGGGIRLPRVASKAQLTGTLRCLVFALPFSLRFCQLAC